MEEIMPRVEYTPTAGLVQRSGSGFALNAIHVTSDDVTLTSGTSVVIITGNHAVSLPTSANEGDIVIAIVTGGSSGNIVNTANANAGSGNLGTGDNAICVYASGEWKVSASAA
tara:strand:+ start:381 stop:719 length:339 start_codon:yes stop_codon:yes gene_type:complete